VENLIWINIDSLRYDYTSLSDSHWETTPYLKSLADRGMSFESCYSAGIKTPTSTASMLTATYPMFTGMYGDAQKDMPVLDKQVTTIAEHLRESGFNTSGISRNIWVSEKSQLDRGFDEFVWFGQSPRKIIRKLSSKELLKYVSEFYSLSTRFGTNASLYSTAPVVSNHLKSELKRLNKKQEPFFLFAHYNEPHRPYLPPRGYFNQYLPDDLSASQVTEHSMWMHSNLYDIIANGKQDQVREDVLSHLYAAEIKHTDDALRRIDDYIDFENTIVIVTGDHGEHLGEFDLYGHQLLPSEETTNVPLIATGFPDSISSSSLVQHIDIMETALQILDTPFEQSQGVNLVSEQRDEAFTEWCGMIDVFKNHNSSFNNSDQYLSGLSQCIFKGRDRYLTNGIGEKLYRNNVQIDNVSSETIGSLKTKLDEYQTEFQADRESQFERSDTAKTRLQDLGYLE